MNKSHSNSEISLSKTPVWLKVIIPIAASLALFLFIIFGIHLPEVKHSLMEQKKSQISTLTQSAIGVLEENYRLYKMGVLTEKQAKDIAVDTISNMKFGPEMKDYFWITDYVPNMIMHPYRTDLNGKSLESFADPKGNYLFNVMVRDTEETGEAYVSYYWQWKDIGTKIVPKLSYVKRFQPWGWIIGTGVYLDDVELEAKKQIKKLAAYTFSVFVVIVVLSMFTIIQGITTNKILLEREIELRRLNEDLEEIVDQRTKELRQTINNLKDTQNQLIETEKMASLGNLVAGVAHEINTPVGISFTSITFLEEKLHDIQEKYKTGDFKRSDLEKFFDLADESIKNINVNLTRAAGLVKSFKQVAVDQTSEAKRTFDLKEYISEVLQSLKPKIKHTQHNVEVNCPQGVMVSSYPGAFMQVLANLIDNSLIHAFEGIEKGKIKIDVIPPDGGEKILTMIYSDNGIGMTEEQAKAIFDPFFTTRRDKGGSGLGMHIVYNIITRKLDGIISVKSEQGSGTEFVINIPVEKV